MKNEERLATAERLLQRVQEYALENVRRVSLEILDDIREFLK